MGEVSYKGHRYPAEIIAHCVWLYHRFPLSFREVEELLLVRGMIVSYETIALRQNRCSRSEICGDGVRSVSVEVRPTATKVNVIPTTWRRLRIIRAELTIGGKAVRSWQASHEP